MATRVLLFDFLVSRDFAPRNEAFVIHNYFINVKIHMEELQGPPFRKLPLVRWMLAVFKERDSY